MSFELLVCFTTWRLAFCCRKLKYFHDPYLRSVSLFYAIVSSFKLLAIAEIFHFAGALRLDNRKVLRCPGCKVSLVFFMNKYESRVLKCLFLSTTPIALSRVCWGVYNCLECDKFASVLLCFICALAMTCGPCGRNQQNCQNCHFEARTRPEPKKQSRIRPEPDIYF